MQTLLQDTKPSVTRNGDLGTFSSIFSGETLNPMHLLKQSPRCIIRDPLKSDLHYVTQAITNQDPTLFSQQLTMTPKHSSTRYRNQVCTQFTSQLSPLRRSTASNPQKINIKRFSQTQAIKVQNGMIEDTTRDTNKVTPRSFNLVEDFQLKVQAVKQIYMSKLRN
jgi:hypothetical protein